MTGGASVSDDAALVFVNGLHEYRMTLWRD